MRTFKRNVVELVPGEQLEVICAGATIQLSAVDDEDNSTIEVIIPNGTMLSGLARLHANGQIDHDDPLQFSDQDNFCEEVRGPVRIIAFVDNIARKLLDRPVEPIL